MKTYNNIRYFINLSLILLLSHYNTLADDGWVKLNTGFTNILNTVFFINPATGWVAGQSPIYGTTNGGINWINEYSNGNADIRSLYFSTNQMGYAVGVLNGIGLILKTTNMGQNWVQQISGVGYVLTSVYFRQNTDTGWAVGAGGIILKTIDGGANWVIKNSGTTSLLTSISHPYSSRGWISKSGGNTVLYSTNSGETWTQQSVGVSDNWVSQGQLCCNGIGWLMGSGNVMRTSNFGVNWVVSQNSTSFIRNSIFFSSVDTGWIVGHNNSGAATIYNTTNSGVNWSSQLTTSYNEDLFSVYFTNNLTGYAVGYSGIILKTTNGGVVTGLNQNTSETPVIFKLYQNYPNPFNPSTKIEFDVPKSEFVNLIIYDAHGREVAKLVSEELRPGSYSVDWNASDYPSGVYFYRLTTGNYLETRKMILIK